MDSRTLKASWDMTYLSLGFLLILHLLLLRFHLGEGISQLGTLCVGGLASGWSECLFLFMPILSCRSRRLGSSSMLAPTGKGILPFLRMGFAADGTLVDGASAGMFVRSFAYAPTLLCSTTTRGCNRTMAETAQEIKIERKSEPNSW